MVFIGFLEPNNFFLLTSWENMNIYVEKKTPSKNILEFSNIFPLDWFIIFFGPPCICATLLTGFVYQYTQLKGLKLKQNIFTHFFRESHLRRGGMLKEMMSLLIVLNGGNFGQFSRKHFSLHLFFSLTLITDSFFIFFF